MKKIYTIAAAVLLTAHMTAGAVGIIDCRIRAAYNLGGTAPLEMPASIRSLDTYRLTPSILAGCDVVWTIGEGFGMLTGLHFENKGMDAGISAKGYRMEMVQGDSRIEGLFYGNVQQKVSEWMLTIPLQGVYHLGSITFKYGPYASVLLKGNFSGTASDGYLRQGDPTGPKITIGSGSEAASYDFSDQMNRFQFGVGAGIDWIIAGGFGLSADLNWGLSGLLKSSFQTVEQTLYPIYGSIGIFYKIGR